MPIPEQEDSSPGGPQQQQDPEHAPAVPWFGLSLIVVGGIFLALAFRIGELGFADNNDPGPRAFPIVLSLILIVGGTADALSSWLRRRGSPQTDAEAGKAGLDVAVLVGLLLVYVVAVPWLGFHLATFPFAAAVAWRLGARWWAALFSAAVLLVLVELLFVQLFKVRLPEGAWLDWVR